MEHVDALGFKWRGPKWALVWEVSRRSGTRSRLLIQAVLKTAYPLVALLKAKARAEATARAVALAVAEASAHAWPAPVNAEYGGVGAGQGKEEQGSH